MNPNDETADPFDTGLAAARKGVAASSPVFPIAGWERYQPVRFLGQGGMGRVFLARDPRLHREVAIKLVRGDDPELSRRLVLEARAQARVDHERVCKVHEVGEISGHVYIAMQYIDGPSLGALAGDLSVAEKVLVVREVAKGAHEAHKAGILHRDLKPSNILVERAEDGSLRPYLADFGLARSVPEGETATSAAVGTPHYMSPEQARGETRSLDRRSDVYSLGATLYHLLSGEPPICGENSLDILSRIATVEPRPLRESDPRIPADLEAVVLKCLEKDPALRHDSARALAEELDRFLNGDPVLSRSSGVFYRLRKRIARHRRLAAALGSALVVVLVAIGFGIKSRLDAAQREKQARRFTEIVERIEAEAKYSALAPLHDVRADRQALRGEMESLAREIDSAGPGSAGPGNYALGRGSLALGDPKEARDHLERAWALGDREPRVAYALAIVLGDLYQAERLSAERIRDEAERATKKREIERMYRDPALAYLVQAEARRVPSPHQWLRDWPPTKTASTTPSELDAMGDGLPWFYEARRPGQRAGDARPAGGTRRSGGATADFEAAGRPMTRPLTRRECAVPLHLRRRA
ncbi:MAG: protein kinase [Polyangiaceae bacterium]